jgi:hypothetical protein
MKPTENHKTFLILDCSSRPIAHGVLLDASSSSGWTMEVQGGKVPAVTEHHELELINTSDFQISYLVRVIGSQSDQITVEPLRSLGSEIRETLRVPVNFHSFAYPLSGSWKGRRAIQAVDLSCGGIAFCCQETLYIGESLEVVIPMAKHPLILTCQILRSQPSPDGDVIYGAKFSDLCDDADKLVQEYVFTQQIRGQAS